MDARIKSGHDGDGWCVPSNRDVNTQYFNDSEKNTADG
jgi:hypothetical protein